MASTSSYFMACMGVCLLGAAFSTETCCPQEWQACCPVGWLGYGGHCYRYYAYKKNFTDAREFCKSKGADIVSIHSDLENDIVQTISHSEEIWIGLHDTHEEATYEWSDGTACIYTKWHSSQPNDHRRGQDCIGMSWHTHTDGVWHDQRCEHFYHFVCKK